MTATAKNPTHTDGEKLVYFSGKGCQSENEKYVSTAFIERYGYKTETQAKKSWYFNGHTPENNDFWNERLSVVKFEI